MTLGEARAAIDLKAVVAYSPEHGDPETGMVTGTSETMALVRYGADPGSKATRPEDLAFMFASDAMLARRATTAGGGGQRGASYSNGPGAPEWEAGFSRPVTHWDFTEGRPAE